VIRLIVKIAPAAALDVLFDYGEMNDNFASMRVLIDASLKGRGLRAATSYCSGIYLSAGPVTGRPAVRGRESGI